MRTTAFIVTMAVCLAALPAGAARQPSVAARSVHTTAAQRSTSSTLPYSFTDKTTGLTFGYPLPMKVTEHPDKDTVVRIEGVQKPTNAYFAITLNHQLLEEGSQPEAAMKMLSSAAYKDARGVKRLGSQSQWLGSRSQFHGVVQDTSVDHEGGRMTQRLVIFTDPNNSNKLVLMTFTTPEQSFGSLEPMFRQVLSSLDHKSPSNNDKAAARPATATYSYEGGVSFSYPREWSVEKEPDRDTLVKMKSDGGELRMTSMPAEYNVSLDQLQRLLDDEILAKVPKYRKLSDVSRSYGGKTSGIREAFSAEYQGMPVLGQVFFFQHTSKLYCIMLTSWSLSAADSEKRFDQIMSSLVLR